MAETPRQYLVDVKPRGDRWHWVGYLILKGGDRLEQHKEVAWCCDRSIGEWGCDGGFECEKDAWKAGKAWKEWQGELSQDEKDDRYPSL